jgi:hypothetical protein
MITLCASLYFFISFVYLIWCFNEYYEIQKLYKNFADGSSRYLEENRTNFEQARITYFENDIKNNLNQANKYKRYKQLTIKLSPILLFIAPIIMWIKVILVIIQSIGQFLRYLIIDIFLDMYRKYNE